MKVKYQKTKTLVTKPNNNSSDAISPNYVYGCAGGCSSYCYMKRYNNDRIYVNTNVEKIEESVSEWVKTMPWPKTPNQQDPTYYMIDIGCNTDMALHQKHLSKAQDTKYGLEIILNFYDNHERLNSTFATKYPSMLYDVQLGGFTKKPRVRVSLMPQQYADVLEPNTDEIWKRMESINLLQESGWEVHLNFSPVIVAENWLNLYEDMFDQLGLYVDNFENIKSEVIFLTNHDNQMANATEEQRELMKASNEVKNKSGVMRYPIAQKNRYVQQFKKLHDEILSIPIRYIF